MVGLYGEGMRTYEHITEETEGCWVCRCGNTPEHDGFHTSSSEGLAQSPYIEGPWDDIHWLCGRCFRIIDGNTLEVKGVASEANAFESVKLWRENLDW